MGKEPTKSQKEAMRILVVDDMINMRLTIRKMLRQLEYVNIIDADDGIDAWDKMSTSNIDLAIVDWNMPRMNGMELLRKARADERLSKIPFIMVTAEVGEETIAEAAESEVDAYIIKPFIVRTLEEKINTVLGKKENPSPLDTLLRQVNVFASGSQFNKAADQLQVALEIDPRSPRVYHALGNLYKQRGMLDDAEKAYKKAILLESKFTKAHDGLADLYAKKGDTEKSIRTLKDAVKRSPRNASRQKNLGTVLLDQGMVKEAKAAFDSAIKAEPKNIALQSEIAETFLARDFDNEAAELFRSVLRSKPDDVHVYNRLGMAYRKQGKFQVAIEEYRKALVIDPGDEHLYYNLGRAYLEAKNEDAAMVQFNKALEIRPDFKEAREALDKIGNGK